MSKNLKVRKHDIVFKNLSCLTFTSSEDTLGLGGIFAASIVTVMGTADAEAHLYQREETVAGVI